MIEQIHCVIPDALDRSGVSIFITYETLKTLFWDSLIVLLHPIFSPIYSLFQFLSRQSRDTQWLQDFH